MRGRGGARCALSLGKTSCPPCRSVGTRLDYTPCFGDWPWEGLDGKQYIVVAAATLETPAELIAMALP